MKLILLNKNMIFADDARIQEHMDALTKVFARVCVQDSRDDLSAGFLTWFPGKDESGKYLYGVTHQRFGKAGVPKSWLIRTSGDFDIRLKETWTRNKEEGEHLEQPYYLEHFTFAAYDLGEEEHSVLEVHLHPANEGTSFSRAYHYELADKCSNFRLVNSHLPNCLVVPPDNIDLPSIEIVTACLCEYVVEEVYRVAA